MTIVWILLALAVAGMVFAFWSLGQVKKRVAEVQALRDETQRKVDEAEAKKKALEHDLAQLKTDLRDQKDENKSLKKARFESKKVTAPAQTTTTAVVAASSTETEQRLEKQWRETVIALDAEKARAATLDAEVATLRTKAAALEAQLATAKGKDEIAAIRTQLDAAKLRAASDEKAVMDMRRKIEWYRRIYLVHQKELEKEQDKTAHVRQRFLDLCVDVVTLQKQLPNAQATNVQREEIDRMKREQAAYHAEQEKKDDAPAATLQ